MVRMTNGLVTFLLLLTFSLQAQDTAGKKINAYRNDQLAYGIGIGYEYAGLIGANITWHPSPALGLTGSFGYAYIQMAGTAGLRLRVIDTNTPKRAAPYLTALYGMQHVVRVEGRSSLNKIFYGMLAGAGVEIRSRKREGYFSLSVIYPFNQKEYDEYIDDLIKYRNVTLKNPELADIPVRLSLGYKWVLR